MSKRVLIIVENLPVPFDRRVWQEASALREAGYSVTIICPVGRNCLERHISIDGIEIFRHPLPLEGNGPLGYLVEYGLALFWQSVLTFRIFVTRGFDVIHACNPPDLIFLVALPYKLLFRKLFVFDHHDINPELYLAKFHREDGFYRLLRWLESLTFRMADISIATNDSYREIAIKRGGMSPDRVYTVRSGPDLARLRPVPPDESVKAGFEYLVGYVGVMGRQEGLSYLLQAVRHIVYGKGLENIRFLLLGSGPDLPRLRHEARDLGVDAWVEFTGHVSDQDLIQSLCACDVCVNPDEANPMNDLSTMNKIMEYMALGKAIVQFDLKEGRVSAQDASLYARRNDPIDFAEKIVALLDDAAARKRMGEFGKERVVSVLSWEHEKIKLLACYESLFHDGGHAKP